MLASFVMMGCTSVNVRPVPAGHAIKNVIIIDNPKVLVSDFIEVMVAGFARHGINARVVPATTEPKNEYAVTYVAFRAFFI